MRRASSFAKVPASKIEVPERRMRPAQERVAGGRGSASPPARLQALAGRSALLPWPLAAPWLPLAVLLATVAGFAWLRPVIAGIDTPALSATWELLRSGGWSGGTGHYPPLLPSLILIAWSPFGVGTGVAWPICAAGLGKRPPADPPARPAALAAAPRCRAAGELGL